MSLKDLAQLVILLAVTAIVWIAAVLALSGCSDLCRTHPDPKYHQFHAKEKP